MAKKSASSASILKDLEEIYFMCLEKRNFSVALKAKELVGRAQGLFDVKKSEDKKTKMTLEELSDDDITHLIKELEAKLKLDLQENTE